MEPHSSAPRTSVVLCGGSAGSAVLLADLGRDDRISVKLLTQRPGEWAPRGVVKCDELQFLHNNAAFLYGPLPQRWVTYEGQPAAVAAYDEAAGMLDADVILIVCPVFATRKILGHIVPQLQLDAQRGRSRPLLLGTAYGQGGFDWLVRSVFEEHGGSPEGIVFFALKQFPFTCRHQNYGSDVVLYHRKPGLTAAVAPFNRQNQRLVAQHVGTIFRATVAVTPDFLACTLGAPNQVLHPAICASYFEDFRAGKVYSRCPRFYKEIDSEAAKAIYDLCFVELPRLSGALEAHGLARGLTRQLNFDSVAISLLQFLRLPRFVLSPIIRWHYSHCHRLSEIDAPMRPAVALPSTPEANGPVAEGQGATWVPDLESRYFWDDQPHGLCVLLGLAELFEPPVAVPRVTALICLAQRWMKKEYVIEPDAKGRRFRGRDVRETGAPQAYGVQDLHAFSRFLGQQQEWQSHRA